MTALALTQERGSTHGDWSRQAATAEALKLQLRAGANWHGLGPGRREALDMIAVKISRILEGDPAHADHWDDIGGYAMLGRDQGHR